MNASAVLMFWRCTGAFVQPSSVTHLWMVGSETWSLSEIAMEF